MVRYKPDCSPVYLIPDKNTVVGMQCRKFEFLRLPGEIRNRVYELLFDDLVVLVQGTHPEKQHQHDIKLHRQRVCKSRCRLFPLFDESRAPKVRGGRDSWMSVDILRTCHRVHKEAVPLLYAKTTFRFESMNTLSKFLDVASPAGIHSIKSLQLFHRTYGEPLMTEYREWKVRHDNRWKGLCKRVADEMTALGCLSIDLGINDWPTQLVMSAGWAKPLLMLKGGGLSRVKVVLKHAKFSEQRLSAMATKFETEMLSDKGRELKKIEVQRERKRVPEGAIAKVKVKAKEGPKALKSLRIKLPSLPSIESKEKPSMPAINVKYLTGYCVREPPVYCLNN